MPPRGRGSARGNRVARGEGARGRPAGAPPPWRCFRDAYLPRFGVPARRTAGEKVRCKRKGDPAGNGDGGLGERKKETSSVFIPKSQKEVSGNRCRFPVDKHGCIAGEPERYPEFPSDYQSSRCCRVKSCIRDMESRFECHKISLTPRVALTTAEGRARRVKLSDS